MATDTTMPVWWPSENQKPYFTSMKNAFCFVIFSLLMACTTSQVENEEQALPNIIIIYIDDLGYGDLSSYGAKGVVTPNVDKLAREGLRFTDGHSPAATCTPSRYSLLTGEYAFRNKAAVLPGDAPLLIPPGTPTLPSMLKKAGYTTGVVGKWHLGLGDGTLDWNDQIKPGPLEVGFDYCFLLPATGDRVPTVYVENHKVIGLDSEDPIAISYQEKIGDEPTGTERPDLLKQQADPQHSNTIVNGISRIGYQDGGEAALWVDEEFPDVFTGKAKEFINQNKDNPFFLFFSHHDIHVPRVPNERFVGKSEMGPRGDAIVQMDWMVGEVMKELEKLGLVDNTWIIFTSDNGPVLNDGYEDQAVEMLGEHKPWGPFRGGKYSAFEAGTRVPTISYWPGRIEPGESSALVSQIDFYASLAALMGSSASDSEARDSENVLLALLGESQTGRTFMVEESYVLSIRKNQWKYIPPYTEERSFDWMKESKGIEGGLQPTPQLYDLDLDIGEQNNLADQHPELVNELQERLDKIQDSTD